MLVKIENIQILNKDEGVQACWLNYPFILVVNTS